MTDTLTNKRSDHLALQVRHFSPGDAAKIILPSVLAILLFVVAIFGLLLPESRDHLIDQKKMSITMLTQTAWNILAHYEQQVQAGKIPLDLAQRSAIEQIRELRYGPEGKDYFWINDTHPAMIMHPYRPDLEGTDIGNYTDPGGKRLFLEFVSVARRDGDGFVPYLWQWKDDSRRIAPKLSYVKLFEAWGWIIGTGVYLDDVETELDVISRESIMISLGILAVITMLSAFIVLQGLREKKRLMAAEKKLQEYHDHLEDLVQKRTEDLGTALSRVKVLSGLLPICSSCKKIRDDGGYWNRIEEYIRDHSEAEFSHGICPDCAKLLYPEIFDRIEL